MVRQPTELAAHHAVTGLAVRSTVPCVGDSPSVGDGLRVAFTLEQCWHSVPGGTARSAIESARALDTFTDVDLVGVAARHRHPPPAAWAPPIPVEMLPFVRPVLYESWHYARRPKVERATGRVHVIHATGGAIPPRTVPLVVTVHDLAFLHDESHFTRHGLRFFKRALALTRRDAAIVLVPSQATADDCIAHDIDADRVRIVPWGIQIESVDETEIAAARARYGLERPFVLWTGTIEPRKNLSTLLRAFAAVNRDTELVLVGPRGWNEDLDALLAPVRSRVRVIGFVPPDELAPLYAAAEVFCYPSLREGFGLPVLEAMAQGTPVVTSAGTSTAEVGGDAVVLVPPTEPGAIAAALDDLLADRDRARALGEAGAQRARTFTWERTADLLATAYRDAVS
jgi:glycosyltransferase involved in cell wall biosynthesis